MAQTAAPAPRGKPATATSRSQAAPEPNAVAAPVDLVERARTLLQNGKATQALAAAQEAQRRDANDYRAAYYVAYALMTLNDLEGAARAQQKALELARTDAQRGTVQSLGEAITGRGKLAEADAALADGLHAKAARLYAAAFDAGLPEPDAGLKAAHLYEQRLGDIATAARLLNGVGQRFPNTAAAATAATELTRMKPALVARARERTEAALRLPAGGREAALREALQLDPRNQDAQAALLAEAVYRDDWAEFERQAKALQKVNQLESVLQGVPLDSWAQEPRLAALLSDMWGDEKVRLLLNPEMSGEWQLQYTHSNGCSHGGTLTINRSNVAGSYTGRMRTLTCNKSDVTQDAAVTVKGAAVTINFSNPRSTGGAYNADNYYLKKVSNVQMKGHNKDERGMGGTAVLTKVR